MLFLDELDKSPSFDDIENLIDYLANLEYPTADSHKRISDLLVSASNKHFDRSTKLCKIESHKGKKSKNQLDLVYNVMTHFEDF